MSNWLQNALGEAIKRNNEQISDELRKVLDMMRPEHTKGVAVIDSTATVIDDVKALPAPKESGS